MGKRRDRRKAALMAAGRRVKLDLSTEPSGDNVGTSSQEGEDQDQNHRAVLASSAPLSPGQLQENPLLLLGQYSDDDLEEEDDKSPGHSAVENSSIDQNKSVDEIAEIEGDEFCNEGKDIGSGAPQDVPDGKLSLLDTIKSPDEGDTGANDSAAPVNQHEEASSVEFADASGISGLPNEQDAAAIWKIVMHEESNRYYYWNTLTGETSWEVPETFDQGKEAIFQQHVFPIIEGNTPMDVYASASDIQCVPESCPDSSIHGPGSACYIPGTMKPCENGTESEMMKDNPGGENAQVLDCDASAIGASDIEVTALDVSGSNQLSRAVVVDGLGGLTSTSKEHIMAIHCKAKDEDNVKSNNYAEPSHVHSDRLLELGESLLNRLKSLEGSGDQSGLHDWRFKCILEIQIRLSDCKALALYGSSLLPFWWHTEAQLKLLESTIGEEETSQFARLEHSGAVETLQTALTKDDTSNQSVEREYGVNGKDEKNLPSTVENAFVPIDVACNSQVLQSSSVHHSVDDEGLETVQDPPHVPQVCEPIDNTQEAKHNVDPLPRAGEDADMDVDMEVDCDNSSEQIITMNATGSVQLELPLPESVEQFCAPPPPEEEWIPPPPPDYEPVPPPPDELPAPLFPLLPNADPAPPPYAEQYNFAYAAPSYEYYAPSVTEVTNAAFFAPTEGCQNGNPHAPPYYEPAANVFPETATSIVNPLEPLGYYDLSNGVPHGPVTSGLESSGFHGQSTSVSFLNNVTSHQIASVGIASEHGYNPVPSSKKDEPDFSNSTETDGLSVKSCPISTATQITGTTLSNEGLVTSLVSADTKNQPKVARSKKRTIAVAPTLRSNKKVSSLVDKWKAAKEELHGDEDNDSEPEDPLQVLEKKRQREIKEWRALQIASGGARDNANFQPLGGDWRERVKRKKAQSNSETVQISSEPDVKEQQRPNLIELSKDLPSGWQAYWDDSSRQVYYGNVITSETTWTRPA